MVDASTRRWLFRGVYLLLCVVLIFGSLLPLGEASGGIPGPDLIFAFTAAFIMRRPRYVPLALVVFVLLLTDLLFLRPVGLWSAIALVALETMRSRSIGPTEMPLPNEVLLFVLAFTSAVMINALAFLTFAIPISSLGTLLLHVVITCAAYPLVLLATHYLLRVRRARPSDIDAVGGTL